MVAVPIRDEALDLDAEGPKASDRRKVGSVERRGGFLKTMDPGSRFGPRHLEVSTRGNSHRTTQLRDFNAADATLEGGFAKPIPLDV
jgi:hypothetical protein